MNKTHAFRLKSGHDLKREIESYVKVNNIHAGWISCGIGSLTDYNIRFANQAEGSKGYGHFEIVSLAGTVSVMVLIFTSALAMVPAKQSVDIY